MFVDACAIIALLSDEPEAQRVSDAIASARQPFTSPVAVLETVLGLARPEKFNLAIPVVESLVMEFLEARGIEIRDLPPAAETVRLSLMAAIAIARAAMASISAIACTMLAPGFTASRSSPQQTSSAARIWRSSPEIRQACRCLTA